MTAIKGQTVSDSQKAVYEVIRQFGPMPDHALVPLVQHAHPRHLSSSRIRTVRSELFDMGLVKSDGVVLTGSGRKAATYKAVR